MVILDATNIKRDWRKPFVKIASDMKAPIYIIFLVISVKSAFERNNMRETRKVPPEVIERFYHDVQLPLFREGYEQVIFLDAKKPLNDVLSDLLQAINRRKISF